MGYFCDNDMTI